ncbi:MAG: glycosyltransferase family 4 protein [Acidobacteriota bacterium]|nr:glycosyltransferase family 4 protein [Acidobacteriota bacterium]
MNSSPKNFIYLWHYLEWGGAQVLFFGLMKEAKKRGEVFAVMPKGSNLQLLKFLNNLEVSSEFFDAHADAAPADSVKRKIERHWKKLYCEFVLLKFVAQFDLKNSVVHTELAPWQSLWALLWLCRKTTVFMTMHNTLPAVDRWRFLLWKLKFQILSHNKNFHLFTANQDTKESLKPFVSGKFFESIKIVYANINPVELDEALTAEVNRATYSKKFNLPKEKFFVFCVGQFIDRKGRWIFLEAAQMLLKDNDDIAFVWISNSKPSTADLEKAQSYGLGENFRFITSDQVGDEHIDLFKLMRLADVFALPSYLEGLPISIIEAMGLGIPTISTEINAIPEAIKHLQTGLLIEAGDSVALKDAIQKLKDNDELRKHLSKNGREYVLAKFNEKAVAKIAVESYIEAYQERLNDN